ncbi:MAG: hypothetical protein V2A58_03325 [Planctomycetota bacterium]
MFRISCRRKGIALITALFLTVLAAGVALSLMFITNSDSKKTRSSYYLTRALMCAETGLERKISTLNSSNIGAGQGLTTIAGYFYGGSYRVRCYPWWTDGTDNDGNGLIDDAAEMNYITLTSVATYSNVTRRIRATVRKSTGSVPNVYGAITLYNPLDANGNVIPGSTVNFSGSPPRVTGNDTNIPTGIPFASLKASDATIGSGAGPDVLGVAVHDDVSVANIISQLGKKTDRVDGVNPTGLDPEALENVLMNGGGTIGIKSVASVNAFDPMNANDIYGLAQTYSSYASPANVYTNSNWPSGSATMGTLTAPQITVLKPDQGVTKNLNGTVTGAGVLVIDGHVKFAGTFNFAGIIIITSSGIAEVELTGTPLVFGAIIAANPDPNAPPSSTLLDLRGTADVYYSSQALDIAEQGLSVMGKVQVLARNEY